MKIGLVGGSYQQRSLPFNAQRTVNLFPIKDDGGKEVSALYGTAGKRLFANIGLGPIRQEFTSANGRFFAVSGSKLYEVDSLGASSELGSFDSSDGIVTMAENNTQLAICDGSKLYILTYSTNDFQKITVASFPTSVGIVTFIDGYFVVNENNTGRFYISGINDGLSSWDALDFATAESSPDNLVSVVNAIGQMWLFGSETTEVWTNTGDSLFPFRRISGAKMQTGILSAFTAVEIDNSVIWVGRDKLGQGIVYRAQGFTPVRISTTPIEILISHATDPTNMRSYVYQEEGNTFYVLTGGGLATTLVYDLLTQEWHERAYLNGDGNYKLALSQDRLRLAHRTCCPLPDKRNCAY
jgi:hypothetical protein